MPKPTVSVTKTEWTAKTGSPTKVTVKFVANFASRVDVQIAGKSDFRFHPTNGREGTVTKSLVFEKSFKDDKPGKNNYKLVFAVYGSGGFTFKVLEFSITTPRRPR